MIAMESLKYKVMIIITQSQINQILALDNT